MVDFETKVILCSPLNEELEFFTAVAFHWTSEVVSEGDPIPYTGNKV